MDASCYLLYTLQNRINETIQLFIVLQSYLLWKTPGVEEDDLIFLLRGHLLLLFFIFIFFLLSVSSYMVSALNLKTGGNKRNEITERGAR